MPVIVLGHYFCLLHEEKCLMERLPAIKSQHCYMPMISQNTDYKKCYDSLCGDETKIKKLCNKITKHML
jgi:hypothetical protein